MSVAGLERVRQPGHPVPLPRGEPRIQGPRSRVHSSTDDLLFPVPPSGASSLLPGGEGNSGPPLRPPPPRDRLGAASRSFSRLPGNRVPGIPQGNGVGSCGGPPAPGGPGRVPLSHHPHGGDGHHRAPHRQALSPAWPGSVSGTDAQRGVSAGHGSPDGGLAGSGPRLRLPGRGGGGERPRGGGAGSRGLPEFGPPLGSGAGDASHDAQAGGHGMGRSDQSGVGRPGGGLPGNHPKGPAPTRGMARWGSPGHGPDAAPEAPLLFARGLRLQSHRRTRSR